ncbi:MAG: AgmX/PglI C-terminal domain-containing protein, partial [Pseudomonadota bacterium]
SLVSDPKRVKEVTDLGLKYSIMTQYTSFVAVDKVKRSDGSVVTVKQPLPLPEGVSNLAVGDGGRGMAMAGGKYMRGGPRQSLAPTAPSPGMVGPITTALKPSAPKEETDAAVKVTEKKDKEKGLLIVSVEEVRGALSRSEVDRVLKNQEGLLEACLKKSTTNRQVKDKGEVVFRLVIGPDGKVKEVKLVTSTLEDVPTQVCFRTVLEQTIFPKPQSGEVTVVIKLSCKLK